MQQDQESGLGIEELLAEMDESGFPKLTSTPEEGNKEKPARVPMMENIMTVVKMLMGSEGTILPSFPQKFHTLWDDAGEVLLLMEGNNGVCTYIKEKRVVNSVLKFCKVSMPIQFRHQFWKLSQKDAKEVVHQWVAQAEPIKEPAMVLQKSKPGLTFHRLPFDMDAAMPTPLFDEFMGRTTNSQALMAWIGSIFDPLADTQQYVWLHGKGKNGKSTLGRLLKKCLGRAAAWKQVPGQQDRFWTHGLLGRRLLIFGDCNSPSFVTTATFKSITGGDGVQVEEKGGAVADVDMKVKALFFSNRRPDIDDEEADTRRIILCEAAPIKAARDGSYEDILWLEAPGILAKCFGVYRTISGPGKDIPTNNHLEASIFDEQDEKFDAFFHEYFDVSEHKKDTLPRADINHALGQYFRMSQPSIPLIRQFKGYLKRKGVVEYRFVKPRVGDQSVNGYLYIVAKKMLVL